MGSQSILRDITRRGTLFLENWEKTLIEEEEDQNARYQLPPTSNIVRVNNNNNNNSHNNSNPTTKQYKHDPLIAPDLIQQIRNNIYIIIANSKSMNGIIFSSEKGDINALLNRVMDPIKNLLIITGLIISQNSIVMELVESINYFLEISDLYFRYCGDISVCLERLQKSFTNIMPAAKIVVSHCEKVAGNF